MADIVLEWNDPRIGTMVGGAPTVWPATDVHGQAYTQVNATILRVSDTAFVVIGPDRGQAIDRVLISPFALPPAPEPEAVSSPLWEDYDLSKSVNPPGILTAKNDVTEETVAKIRAKFAQRPDASEVDADADS